LWAVDDDDEEDDEDELLVLAPLGLEILVDSPITSLNIFSMKCTAAKQAIAPRIAKKMIDLNVPSRNL
jgi:hypothetical protein